MTGSTVGPVQKGLVAGFRPQVMVGVGDPDKIVLAPSGTFFVDYTAGTQYRNDSAGAGAGSEWAALT